MEVREVELKIEKLRSFKVRRVKEKWSIVKFGDKEFVMPKDTTDYFVRSLYRNSIFHLYFDGNNVLLEDPYLLRIPVGTNKEAVKEYRFIVLDENAELWKPEDYTLIAKENGLALYTTDDDRIMYRNGKEHTILFRYDKRSKLFFKQSVIFDTEKPLNEETFNLIRRIHNRKDKTKQVCMPENYSRFEIGILDDDINVYVGEKHYFMVLENAEIVRVNEELIAIKGDKTYLEIDRWHAEDEINFIKEGNRYLRYVSKYRMFNYEFNPINVLKIERDKVIAEVPNLDAEITVRKFIEKVEPELIDTYPKTWHFKELDPKLVGKKTYKLKDLVRKLNDADRYGHNYRVDIGLAVNV